jgi:hypothetical protein
LNYTANKPGMNEQMWRALRLLMIYQQHTEEDKLTINNIHISMFTLLEKAENADAKLKDND